MTFARQILRSFTVWLFVAMSGPCLGNSYVVQIHRTLACGAGTGNETVRGQLNIIMGSAGIIDGDYAVSINGSGVWDWRVTGGVGVFIGNGYQPTNPSFTGFSMTAPTPPGCGVSGQVTWTYALTKPGGSTATIDKSSTLFQRCDDCSNAGDNPEHKEVITLTIGTGGFSGTALFTANMHVGKNAKAHTISLVYNGATVQTSTSPVNNSAPTNTQLNFTNATAHNLDTWSIVVDGVTQQSGTVTLVNIGTIEAPVWQYQVTYDTSIAGGDAPTPTPSATPTPTAFPTATPYATPTPTPGGTPPPSVIKNTIGGGTVFSQAVTVVNPQDIYNPITAQLQQTNQLLSQAAQNTGHTTIDNPTDISNPITDKLNYDTGQGTGGDGLAGEHEEGDYDDRGHLDDLQGQADAAVSARDDVVGAVTGGVNHLMSVAGSLSGMTFGSVSSIAMPFHTLGNAPDVGKVDLPTSIDITDFLPAIGILREVLLWLLRIGFFVMTYRLVMSRGVTASV